MNRQHSLSSSLLRSCRQWQRVSTAAASKPSEIMTLVGLLQGAFGLRIFNAKHRRSLSMVGCMGKSIQRQGQQHGIIRCIKQAMDSCQCAVAGLSVTYTDSGQGSTKVIESGAIRQTDMVSYRCFIVQFSLTFDFKNDVTLQTGIGVRQSHWKCHHSIERI